MEFSAENLARTQAEMRVTMARLERAMSLMPATTAGWDTTESVCVELDRNARLTRVSFRADWHDQLEAHALDDGVLAAYAAAHRVYGVAAERARDEVDELPDSEFNDDSPEDPVVELLSARRHFPGAPRSVDEIAEDFLAIPMPSPDEIDTDPDAGAEVGIDDEIAVGSAPKNVWIVLEGDHLASIRFDARWADAQSGAALESAVASALQAARSSQRASPAADTSASRDVIADALQLLTDLANPPTGSKEI